jgi:hypothetical protein
MLWIRAQSFFDAVNTFEISGVNKTGLLCIRPRNDSEFHFPIELCIRYRQSLTEAGVVRSIPFMEFRAWRPVVTRTFEFLFGEFERPKALVALSKSRVLTIHAEWIHSGSIIQAVPND